MDIIPVPTCSTQGFVTDSKNKINFLLAHFFLSLHSQTALYPNEVTSWSKIIQETSNQPELLVERLQLRLQAYIGRYYPKAVVSILAPKNIDELDEVKFDITISISIIETTGPQEFEKELSLTGDMLQGVIKLLNEGTTA